MRKNISFLQRPENSTRSFDPQARHWNHRSAIEHYLGQKDKFSDQPTQDEARLFIRPPYSFLGVDHLLTNFHLPGSTCYAWSVHFLLLDKDGIVRLKDIYAEAIESILFLWRRDVDNLVKKLCLIIFFFNFFLFPI